MRTYNNYEFPAPLIQAVVPRQIDVSIVIPSYNENFILDTLNSLLGCKYDNGVVEVIIVINDSEASPPDIHKLHKKQHIELLAWAKANSTDKLLFYPLYIAKINKKTAGAGMARKIGMDEAFIRFNKVKNPYGIISNLDADTTVQENYLQTLINESKDYNKTKAYSIHFEHSLDEQKVTENIRNAIIDYELHLRYYINMQKILGFPFAYQTVGSAMAVRSYAYGEAFGMNKRQAGEDFYFLQKFIKTGYFDNINTTTVFPATRVSDRVPFGTGKSVSNIVENKIFKTYNFQSFESISDMDYFINALYQDFDRGIDTINPILKSYLIKNNFKKKYLEIKKHTKDLESFNKRFYTWFDAFRLMKYLHFCRDRYYENIPIELAIKHLFNLLNYEYTNKYEALIRLRNRDKNG